MLTPFPACIPEISKSYLTLIIFQVVGRDNISVPSFSAGSGSGIRGTLEELRVQRAQGGQRLVKYFTQTLNHSTGKIENPC